MLGALEPNTPNPFLLCFYDVCAGLEESQNGFEIYFSDHQRGQVKCQSGFSEGFCYKFPKGVLTSVAVQARPSLTYPSVLGGPFGAVRALGGLLPGWVELRQNQESAVSVGGGVCMSVPRLGTQWFLMDCTLGSFFEFTGFDL